MLMNNLKIFLEGTKLNKDSYMSFVESLDITIKSKEKLLSLEPKLYIGISRELSKS